MTSSFSISSFRFGFFFLSFLFQLNLISVAKPFSTFFSFSHNTSPISDILTNSFIVAISQNHNRIESFGEINKTWDCLNTKNSFIRKLSEQRTKEMIVFVTITILVYLLEKFNQNLINAINYHIHVLYVGMAFVIVVNWFRLWFQESAVLRDAVMVVFMAVVV